MSIDFDSISAASAVTPNTAANTNTNKNPVAGSQDYFLKLLVAQMNNQDPLNPLDSAQMTSQLAQLNTVQGINNLATKLDSLLGDVNTSQSLQASSLVGHAVLAPGNTLALTDGQALGGVELGGAVDHLTVTIKDAGGNVIHTADLGAQTGGIVNFVWDGSTTSGAAAIAGSYTFSVDGKLAGTTVATNGLSAGVVSSVTPTATGASLLVSGVGTFDMTQIKQIY
jgi:flagellar basal-body rod modification protein FlgD